VCLSVLVGLLVVAVISLDKPDDDGVPGPATSTKDDAFASGVCSADQATPWDTRLGRTWTGVYMCPNVTTLVYERPEVAGKPISRLRTNPSWFACWTRGEEHAGGNDVWYYTQGDDTLSRPTLEAWGFVPAASVGGRAHPDPGVARQCQFRAGMRSPIGRR
jgi:hypothetical protein